MPEETPNDPPLAVRVKVLELGLSEVKADVRGIKLDLDRNGRENKEHLTKQDRMIERVLAALFGDEKTTGLILKLDRIIQKMSFIERCFWIVIGAIASSVLFAVAAYVIHR